MECKNCHRVLPDSTFCPYCGTQLAEEAGKAVRAAPQAPLQGKQAPRINPYVIPEAPKSPKEPKSSEAPQAVCAKTESSSRKKGPGRSALIIGAVLGGIAAVVTVVVLMITLVLVPSLRYSHAMELLEQGSYDLAYREFSELGDYSDAGEMLLETRYLQAKQYRQAGDYTLANDIFQSLDGYKDSEKLIHYHSYKLTRHTDSTCTQPGLEEYTCAGCGDSYVESLEAAHSYEVIAKVDSTCSSLGSKTFRCAVCGDEYTQTIEMRGHLYEEATCTLPKTCTRCNHTTGTALGHTNNVICARCRVTTFKKLTYEGHGPSTISNLTLPVGTYNLIFTHNGKRNFAVYFSPDGSSQNLIVNEIGAVSYTYRVASKAGSLIRFGYINITMADGDWTLSIEAVSNG